MLEKIQLSFLQILSEGKKRQERRFMNAAEIMSIRVFLFIYFRAVIENWCNDRSDWM